MRRTPLRAKPRAEADRVTPELYRAVMGRDRGCVLAKLRPGRHVCRDRWGYVRSPHDSTALSLEHVKEELRMGQRGPSDEAHCLVLCFGSNVGVPSKEERAMLREYLRRLYPAEWGEEG